MLGNTVPWDPLLSSLHSGHQSLSRCRAGEPLGKELQVSLTQLQYRHFCLLKGNSEGWMQNIRQTDSRQQVKTALHCEMLQKPLVQVLWSELVEKHDHIHYSAAALSDSSHCRCSEAIAQVKNFLNSFCFFFFILQGSSPLIQQESNRSHNCLCLCWRPMKGNLQKEKKQMRYSWSKGFISYCPLPFDAFWLSHISVVSASPAPLGAASLNSRMPTAFLPFPLFFH